MRAPDFFQNHKCIHIKLTKDVYMNLRIKLFQRGLSIQEIFDEFAKLVADGSPRALGIVDNLVQRNIQEIIDGRPTKHRKKVPDALSELDSDELYKLINGDQIDSEEKGKK